VEPELNSVVELLTAAASAGHTVLPPEVVLRTCAQVAIDDSLDSGAVIGVEWHGTPALALVDVAESEELLADGLLGLAEENRLAVVVGTDPAARRRALDSALGAGVPSVVLDDAHLVGLDEVLAAVEDLPEDAVLALSLDNALPLGPVLGAVALDVAASGRCPVLKADAAPPRSALDRARVEVAAGRWFATSPDDRSVVEVTVPGPDEAVRRVTQLVSVSIPRAFDAAGDDVVVLLATGSVDADVVRRALDDAGAQATAVRSLSSPLDRPRAAAVVVLPGPVPTTLTRAQVYAGLRAGERHVSVVHGRDAAGWTTLLAATTDAQRRTRLAELLAD
jgi:hypothetical protein